MVSKGLKAQAVLVSDFMIENVYRITPKMKLREVAEFFMAKKISGAPVTDEADHVISLIGEGALLELLVSDGVEATVAHCLPKLTPVHKMVTLKKYDPFEDAYRLFIKHGIHRIPVVDDSGKLIGMISRGAVFRLVVEAHHGKKLPK